MMKIATSFCSFRSNQTVTGKAGLEVRGYEVSRLKDERTSREGASAQILVLIRRRREDARELGMYSEAGEVRNVTKVSVSDHCVNTTSVST